MTKLLPSILTGILCVMSMFADNVNRIGWNQLPISLAFGILVGLFFWFIFWLNPPTNKSAPFVSTIFTACFLLFYAITPWVSLVLVIIALVVGIKFKLAKITKPLTVMLACAVIVSTGMALVSTNWDNAKVSVERTRVWADSSGTRIDRLPNIYFIIPDRMPSIDAMTESDIDSTEFVAKLRTDGFYVKENQLSYDEYTQTYECKVTATRTMRYLASVLNDGQVVGLQTPYSQIFSLIRNPAIIAEVHALGYEYHHIGSWFTESYYSPNADVNYVYKGGTLWEKLFKDEFTTAVWNRTVLKGVDFGWFWKGSIDDVSRDRLVYQMESIRNISLKQNQHFAFAHLILPHEPFIFTARGLDQTDKTLSESELYYEQIKYAMNFLDATAKMILRSDPNAIILIQSDEGMAYSDSRELTEALSDTQWNGVLTAWRIPGADESELEQLKHTEILKYLVEWLK